MERTDRWIFALFCQRDETKRCSPSHRLITQCSVAHLVFMMIHFTCNTYIYTNLYNCSLYNVLTIFWAKRWLNELQALFRFCRQVRTALFVQDAVSCLPRLEGTNRRIRSNFDGDSKQISPAISTSSSSSFSSSSSPSSSNETSTETLVPQKFGCFG